MQNVATVEDDLAMLRQAIMSGADKEVVGALVDWINARSAYDGRFGDGRVDVTDRVDGSTGASSDYRVTFNDDLDWTLSDRVVEKNRELGDGWIKDGHSLDDVA